MIKKYFLLQYKLLKRGITDFGFHPLAGITLAVLLFAGISVYLFRVAPHASYLYIFSATALLFSLSEKERNDFLSIIFRTRDYYKIRLLENIVFAGPFLPLLLWHHCFIEIFVLVTIAVLFSFHRNDSAVFYSIPTPFYKKPFEFIVSFRKLLAGFIACYALSVIALLNANMNLAVFSLLLAHLLCIASYNEPEPEFYVWTYKKNPKQFLTEKIRTGLVHSQLLTAPLLILLSGWFSDHILILLGFQLLGACYLVSMIAAKYAAWPGKLNLPQSLLFAGSVALPPLMLVTTPYFIIQSQKKLNSILV